MASMASKTSRTRWRRLASVSPSLRPYQRWWVHLSSQYFTLPPVILITLLKCIFFCLFIPCYYLYKLQVNSPEAVQRIVKTVAESTAKIIVVFSSDVDLSPLITGLLQHNVTNRTWIASEAWVTSALINQPGVSAQSPIQSEHLQTWATLYTAICACFHLGELIVGWYPRLRGEESWDPWSSGASIEPGPLCWLAYWGILGEGMFIKMTGVTSWGLLIYTTTHLLYLPEDLICIN